jgi:glutathione synthase
MAIDLGIVMDPIAGISIKKDSSFAMLLAAQRRGWRLWYLEVGDLFLHQGLAQARVRRLAVQDDPVHWYDLGEEGAFPLSRLDVVLMRKDPPFDMEYIYATYLLELAEAAGVLVVNARRNCATPTRSSSPPGSPTAARKAW